MPCEMGKFPPAVCQNPAADRSTVIETFPAWWRRTAVIEILRQSLPCGARLEITLPVST